MRKALIVGIDYYEHIDDLTGCVNDAYSVKQVLERNADGTINFGTARMLIGTGPSQAVPKQDLKAAVRELFEDDSEIALLYFSGHGYVEDTGGFLTTSDSATGDDGLSLTEVMNFANSSPAKNRVLILDSCYSGSLGTNTTTDIDHIREGVTILTASTARQTAMESVGSGGVFTTLLVDALNGAAANLVGEITPGSVYAHIDQSLGVWAQRPVFKTNIKKFISLREVEQPITLEDLRALTAHFPTPDAQFQLDPSYEPRRSAEEEADPDILPPDAGHNTVFALLQRYVKVNLLRPSSTVHMYDAAMESGACELTALGQHYWRLVNEGLI